MPSGPVLSEADKNDIRDRLQVICEHCLTVYGYKKTSVKELCAKAEIAIGTFYSLYPTKEDLFFETVKNIQERLTQKILDINQNNPTKEGFAISIKELFREYDSKPFLYNVSTPDFQAFLTKLPKEAMEKIKFESIEFFRNAIRIANLKLKIDENQAYAVLSALLSTISARETLAATCDYFAVFDFMVDKLIPSIFEEE
jgi:AcrR family transcriptional regulator